MIPTPQLLNQVANFIQTKGKFSYYCLFLLGKEAGLRVSEAINFDLSLKKKSNLYLIQGKCHKKRVVFIDPSVISELRKNHWQPQPTNRFSYAHFLQRTKKELNISKSVELTPHTLRRCFATYQAQAGMPLPLLQKVLGHSSIRTTALYWKDSADPQEKDINDKWLKGKVPQEPSQPIADKPKNLLEFPKNNGEISPPNQPRNSKPKLLTTENKNLKEKIKQLEYEKQEQQQIIINLKNDKELLKKQLIQVKKEKDVLLKMLSIDLQRQQENLSHKEQNNQALHQQLVAQIEVLTKN